MKFYNVREVSNTYWHTVRAESMVDAAIKMADRGMLPGVTWTPFAEETQFATIVVCSWDRYLGTFEVDEAC